MTTLDEELIALRREIHRRPELAGEERETAGLVAEQLRAAGLDVTTGVGGHGVVAVLDGSADGPTVLYRADMDAVDARTKVLPFPPSDREFDEGFASRVPGVAHLCGHDVHTAVGVGVARTLARDPGRVRGRLAFVFQPAEENLQGARAMLATGLVQRLAPRECYALHCAPFPTGTLAVSPGYGLPGLDHFRIVLPDGDEAAAAAVAAEVAGLGTVTFPQSVADYQARFHQVLDPAAAASTREFVCVAQWTEHTPEGRPVPNGLLRVWPQERNPGLREQVIRLAAAAGGHVEFPGDPFPAMVNSAELSAAAGRHLAAALGPESVLRAHASWPYNCEDFALFLSEAPGAMLYLGVANAEEGMNGAPHTPSFAADERAIGHGVRAMAGLLTDRLAADPAGGGPGRGPDVATAGPPVRPNRRDRRSRRRPRMRPPGVPSPSDMLAPRPRPFPLPTSTSCAAGVQDRPQTGQEPSVPDSSFAIRHDDAGTALVVSAAGTDVAHYVYRPGDPAEESPKPYLYPLRTLSGAPLGVYRPWDHRWHKGLQMTWTDVSGDNFWGGPTFEKGAPGDGYVWKKNQGRQQHRSFEALDGHGTDVGLRERLDWISSTGQAWLDETRTLRFHRADAERGVWALDFGTDLACVRDEALRLGSPTTLGRVNAGYTGLFWRGPRAWTGGEIVAAGGRGGESVMGAEAAWAAVTGEHDGIDGGGTVLALRGTSTAPVPIRWFARSSAFACLNPSPAFDTAITLEPGESVGLRHRFVFVDRQLDRGELEALAAEFAL